MERAIKWSVYLETHAQRVYHPIISAAIDSARLLAKKLGDVPNPFALRDVYRNCWTGLADPQAVEQAAIVLEEFDWLIAKREATAGRTRLTYEINPKVLNMPRLSTDKTDRSQGGVPF